MKKFLLIAIAFFTFAACDDEDNSALWDEVKNQGNKIEMLESEIEALKLKIEGLNQTFKAVSAMLNGGLITKVEAVTGEDGKSGYKLTVQTYDETSGTEVNTYTIWNGGDGSDGTPGSTPQIGIELEEETGLYYWTLDGEPMLDDSGKKLYATAQDGEQGAVGKPGTDGVTPQLRITDENKWEISYDKGATWQNLGVFSGNVSVGSSIQVEVDDDNNVIIKEGDKVIATFPILEANTLDIKFTNINATTGMRIMKNSVYVVKYELNEAASANANVKVEMLNGTNFEVEKLSGNEFKVTAKAQDASDVVLVHVYDGTVCMHTSFNITSTTAITEPNVLLELGQNEVTYPVQLTLPEGITGKISITFYGNLPAGAVTVSSSEVTFTSGQGSFDVTINPATLIAGRAYTLQFVFSGEDTDYQVLGSMTMVTGIPKKISITEDMLGSIYTHTNVNDGGNISALCDGDLSTYWGSNYNADCPAADPVYGVFIEISLVKPLVAVKFRYYTRSYANAVPKALVVGVMDTKNTWETLFTHDEVGLPESANTWWEGDVLHAQSDNTPFTDIRFGITHSKAGNLIEIPKNSTAFAELEVWGLY